MKTYSSGMVVRLAFAVQAQVRPQILIVDEALAVGDAKFQAKCFTRLKQLKDDGSAILFVTHSSEQIIAHCDRAVLIDGGKLLHEGKPKDVVNRYMDLLFGNARKKTLPAADETSSQGATSESTEKAQTLLVQETQQELERYQDHPNYNSHEYRWGDGAARILDFALTSGGVAYPAVVGSGADMQLALRIKFVRDVFRPILGVTIKTKEGITVYGSNSENLLKDAFNKSWKVGALVDIAVRWKCRLAAGDYFISTGIASRDGMDVIPHDRRYDSIHIHVSNSDFFGLSDLELEMDEPREIVVSETP